MSKYFGESNFKIRHKTHLFLTNCKSLKIKGIMFRKTWETFRKTWEESRKTWETLSNYDQTRASITFIKGSHNAHDALIMTKPALP